MTTTPPPWPVRPIQKLATDLLGRSTLIVATVAGGKTVLLNSLARRIVHDRAGVVWWLSPPFASTPPIADWTGDATTEQAATMVDAALAVAKHRAVEGHVAQGCSEGTTPTRPDLYLLVDGDGTLDAGLTDRLAQVATVGDPVGVYVAFTNQTWHRDHIGALRDAPTARVLGRIAGDYDHAFHALFGPDARVPRDWRPVDFGDHLVQLVPGGPVVGYRPVWPFPQARLHPADVEAAGPSYDGVERHRDGEAAA